jgi:hypothetical protein
VTYRPLATVTGLAIGDYLLWNWSLNANHDVLALVSGLTLPPLAIALLWLLALSAARLLGRATRSSSRSASASPSKRRRLRSPRTARAARTRKPLPRASTPASPSASATTAATAAAARTSRKIAA